MGVHVDEACSIPHLHSVVKALWISYSHLDELVSISEYTGMFCDTLIAI